MKLAVIGTFYKRHEATFPLLHRTLVAATRPPDELWVMCEGGDDYDAALDALAQLQELELPVTTKVWVVLLPTPQQNGAYEVIPYSNKINYALDHSDADAFVYLDNGSFPSPYKFEVMARALEEHPEWGAVYCAQKRTGFSEMVCEATGPVEDAFCVLNYTQVMHRRSPERWPLDMRWANPDLADALFWRQLHKHFGAFHPADAEVHDEHHIPTPAAAGIS